MTQQQEQFAKALERAEADEAQKAATRAARKAIADAKYEAFKRAAVAYAAARDN